jgi:radical SAM superfamily enzyme YgiQ (UPF0313 family)
MNVLLIYPEFPDTFWSFKHALRFVRRKAAYPPLGLLTVSSMLPADWNRRLVDLNISSLSDDDTRWADFAFISGMTVQRESAQQVISRCKRAGITTVAGGPLFTSEHAQFPDVDHFVLNEAEVTLPEFLADFRTGTVRRMYETREFPDLADTPAPDWSLVDFRAYASMPVQYSRGCPFDCEFCNVTTLFGHMPRVKNPDQMLVELDALYDAGWRGGVFFVDDNLIGNKRHLKTRLLPALVEWRRDKVGIEFNTEASINLADDPALMRLMVAAGFTAVFVGIETTEEISLRECGKTQNQKRDMLADVQRIQEHGMEVQGGFILGFGGDTASTFERLTDFVQHSGIVTAMVGLLQALPGTKLFERMRDAGRLLSSGSGDNFDGETNILPLMNGDELRRKYREVLDYLYSPKNYYSRVRTFLRTYQRPKMPVRKSFRNSRRDLMAFLRTIVRLGVVGKERFQYWKLLTWTLFRKPRSLPMAIRFSIYGYHFRRVCELHVG